MVIPMQGDRVRIKSMPEYEGVVEAIKTKPPYVMRVRTDAGGVFHAYAGDVELVPYIPPVDDIYEFAEHWLDEVPEFTVPTFSSVEEAEQWMESLNAGTD